MIFGCAAWAGHTPESREMAEDIKSALVVIGLKQEAAAHVMGISPTKLADQLAGREPLNHFRLAFLGTRFEIALMVLRARRVGADLITPEQITYMKAAARLGPRRMLKAGMGFIFHNERKVG